MRRRRPLFPPTSIATRFCRFIQGRFAITAKSEKQGRQTKRRARSATGFSSQPICLPKTLSVLIGERNHLTSAHLSSTVGERRCRDQPTQYRKIQKCVKRTWVNSGSNNHWPPRSSSFKLVSARLLVQGTIIARCDGIFRHVATA